MLRTLLITLSLSLSSPVLAQDNEIIVVANSGNSEISLNKKQIRDLFMGGFTQQNLEPISLPPNNPARVVFNTKVVGLTEARITSYWAQMRFSGRGKPPKTIDNVNDLLAYVQANEGSVAYLPANTSIPEGLTVVYSSQ